MSVITETRTPAGSEYAVTDRGFGVQWRAVLAAAVAGLAVTLILTTLGAAIGLSAGAGTESPDAQAMGTGVFIWWLLTVAVTGVIAGRILATTARTDLYYNAIIYGTLAWVVGVTIFLFLLANGLGALAGGLGAGMGAAQQTTGGISGSGVQADQMARDAASVGQRAAWGLLISQLVGLGATIVAAKRGKAESMRRA